MAGYTMLGRRIPTTGPTTLGAPSPPQSSACGISSLLFPRSFTFHQARSDRHREAASGRCGGVRGRLVVLSVAETNDRNERLKEAAKAGDLDTVNEILGFSGVSIDLPSNARAGWTALHLASFYDHPAIVKRLLKAGAGLEIRNDSGNTALQLASLRGNIDVARILLESGADIYAQSADKGTAMDYAQEWGGEEIVNFLYEWVSKANLKV